MSSKSEKNPLSDFVTEKELHFTAEVRTRLLERISVWSKGIDGIEWAAALLGGFDTISGKVMPVVVDFIELPAYNTASRQNAIQINVDDFERLRKAKKNVIAFLHTHPTGDLLPSVADWATFSWIYAMDPDSKMLFVIMSPNGRFAVYDFGICNLYPRSFVGLFKREKENAKKQNHRDQADRPAPGEV